MTDLDKLRNRESFLKLRIANIESQGGNFFPIAKELESIQFRIKALSDKLSKNGITTSQEV